MTCMRFASAGVAAALCALLLSTARADIDLNTKFINQGSVANTRHNLTQRQAAGGGPSSVLMDPYRNDYGEVCVYCHTPHGSNADIQLPLWNHTVRRPRTSRTMPWAPSR